VALFSFHSATGLEGACGSSDMLFIPVIVWSCVQAWIKDYKVDKGTAMALLLTFFVQVTHFQIHIHHLNLNQDSPPLFWKFFSEEISSVNAANCCACLLFLRLKCPSQLPSKTTHYLHSLTTGVTLLGRRMPLRNQQGRGRGRRY
jgi:hypothetical protein